MELTAYFAMIADFFSGLPYAKIARYFVIVLMLAVLAMLVFGEQVIEFFSNVEDRIDSGTELEQ